MRPSQVHVRGLPLPELLLDLLAAKAWPPFDGANAWFEDPMDFLADLDQLRRESASLEHLSEDPDTSAPASITPEPSPHRSSSAAARSAVSSTS
ncbi:hypothetical protein [Nonomuraea gerenzanensis]|uniref:Uncharacterized protein n=1 Tax=Nonomuraea gerenzanensis TaxID=93944 RepID=A0A1M4DZK1_9ACTN|nr:hypothetical protein [Nonomuraea gerenzanensis]UBU14280.1 hypothetical protein LCN96_04420 [Nonomuraea gerenzanensis]SBO91981.1 hypothetical protein BN4615_P1495 [Nonomuraea gerenzanensis]